MGILESVLSYLKPILETFLGSHPAIVAILLGIGASRVIFKAFFSFLHAIADATPSVKDNELLGKAEASKAYKVVAFILDYLFSIKLPPKSP